jgi:hypothetical protein
VVYGAADVASAQSRCDCSRNQGECQATVSLDAGTITITSSSPRCSQVVYFENEQPRSVTLTGGSESSAWLGSGEPVLRAGSCQICFDREHDREPEAEEAGPSAECRELGVACQRAGERATATNKPADLLQASEICRQASAACGR